MKPAIFVLLFLLAPAWALGAKDPKDYPLRIEILMNRWQRYRPRPVRDPNFFIYRVNGQGNLIDGNTVHAFDFKYENDLVIRFTAPNQTYFARWKKSGRELEVMAPEIGHEGKYITCVMDISVREGVYAGRGSGIHEVSQAAYQEQKAHAETAATQSPQQSAAVANVSVTSNPAGADIEVDGELMGMTPSVLQLTVGEHTVALQKSGFKSWQRKMNVVSGDIRLNADLEPDAGK